MIKSFLKSLLNIKIIYLAYRFSKATCRFMHKGITALKALAYYIWWNLKNKRNVFKQLSQVYGLKEIKSWNPLRWKSGTIYLKAKKNGHIVFVKACGKIDTTKREIIAISKAQQRSDYLRAHTPNLYTVEPEIDDVIIEEEIKGLPLNSRTIWTDEKRREIIEQIFNIYLELKNSHIKHLDIRPANFIISGTHEEPIVILIDFGYALVDSSDIHQYLKNDDYTNNILKKLGSSYSYKDGTLDDAYSFYLTLKELDPSLMNNFPDIWMTLNNDMGLNSIVL